MALGPIAALAGARPTRRVRRYHAVMRRFVAPLGLACVLAAGAPAAGRAAAPVIDYTIVQTFPHDSEAFTQGLDFWRGRLLETTGLHGASSLRRVRLRTGEVVQRRNLAERYFGEGMTVFKRKLYWLTWQAEKAFVHRPKTFRRVGTLSYAGQGWGLTHNGRRLIMSNGSDRIVFRRPGSFEITRRIQVTDGGEPVDDLNELEWVDGAIFANVWLTDWVVRIDPRTGNVTGRLDLARLRQMEQAAGDPNETNGIAYLASQDRLFVTGKNWSRLYEIRPTG